MGYYGLTHRQGINIDDPDRPVSLFIPSPEAMRFPGSLVSASNVTFTYPKSTITTLDSVTLTIHPGTRVGLVGKNGQGKSTLVKLLIGTLVPSKGTIERHPRLRFGYFDQHSVEVLSGSPEIERMSSVEYFNQELKRVNGIEVDDGMARGFLGSFGLQGAKATNPIGTLSGGQKVTLRFPSVSRSKDDVQLSPKGSPRFSSDRLPGTGSLGAR